MYPNLDIREEIGAILLGTSKELSDLAEEVNTDTVYPLEFRAIVHPELVQSSELKNTIRRLVASGEVSTVVADMGNHSIDSVLQFIYDITFIKRAATFIDARRLYQEIFQRLPLSLIDDRWILRYVSLSPHSVYSVLKRSFDIVAAIILGLLSLSLYPFIILAIRLDNSKNSEVLPCRAIFYSADRVGMGGRLMRITKFRTMTGCDDGQDVLETKHTVTRVGKFLRRTRLDELPQLWSVLKGEMSFVGPRPEFPELVDEYVKEIKYYNLRHLVKPGLSGWAQIMHDAHSHHKKDTDSTKDKLAYDLFYVKERSLWMDLHIALLTLKTIISKKGS